MTVKTKDNDIGLEQMDYGAVLEELIAIREEMVIAPAGLQSRLSRIHPRYHQSACNLLHYLSLRRRDHRTLQVRLAALGLSSLGRAESNVLATVDAVLEVLCHLTRRKWTAPGGDNAGNEDLGEGRRLLADHTEALLGPPPRGREVRIMVTMPSEAADDYTLVHNLLKQGMDCMRINCAHDNAEVWQRMIENLRRAERSLGRTCRIAMDLAGPKLRTGPIEAGPAVVRVRPQRDVRGRIVAPARVWLTSESSPQRPPTEANASIPVSAAWLASLGKGDGIRFTDARNAKRGFTVVDVTDQGVWAEAIKTAYLVPGTVLRHEGSNGGGTMREAKIGALPCRENALTLLPGDLLILTREMKPGRPATQDSNGDVLTPATIGCTIPEVFDDVRSGETIAFDDGKIGGIIEKVEPTNIFVRITRARLQGEKLRGDKGINLPDSALRLPSLTAKDLEDLAFVAQHADMVALSFVNSAGDVEQLLQHLAQYENRQPAIVLKIETRRGFENLPDMLLTVMQAPCCGVMIARGDLAVECGFERLAELQEEILWSCEAAHVPVIWATQVLESLAKEGMPSRAEITDAAMAQRAECVMLNKGPHILAAVQILDGIMRRMQDHQAKKRPLLRELRLAHSPSIEPVPPPSRAGH